MGSSCGGGGAAGEALEPASPHARVAKALLHCAARRLAGACCLALAVITADEPHLQRSGIVCNGSRVAVGELVHAAQQVKASSTVRHLEPERRDEESVRDQNAAAGITFYLNPLLLTPLAIDQCTLPSPLPAGHSTTGKSVAPHLGGVVVWHQRRLCLRQLAQRHATERKQVAALVTQQALRASGEEGGGVSHWLLALLYLPATVPSSSCHISTP